MKVDLGRNQLILIKKKNNNNKNTTENQQTAITEEARKVKRIGWRMIDEMELILRAMRKVYEREIYSLRLLFLATL
jgi:hypothetical protein